tara:strand:+ start:8430 stop:10517 length:2088 start_codon:yes stop_codon:yes gene_type:complete
MYFNKKYIYKIISKFFSICKTQDWEWTYDNPNFEAKDIKWHALTKKIISINVGTSDIWFRPKLKLNNNWYILCIFHNGFNRSAYGFFKNGIFGHSQGRLVSSGKRRFRVIKNLKGESPLLCISNLEKDLKIKELTLYPIPFFYAFMRINRRLRDFKDKFEINSQNKSLLWRTYNKALNISFSKSKIISYFRWIKDIEQPFLKRYYKKDNNFSSYFSLQLVEDLNYVKNYKWVIPVKKNDLIPKWSFYFFYKSIQKNKNCLILYADEDCIKSSGERYNPNFKSLWNRELFISNENFGNSWIISTEIWNKALDESRKYTSKRDFKIVLFLCVYLCESYKKKTNNIHHLPIIGYHNAQDYNGNNLSVSRNDYQIFLQKFLSKKWSDLGNFKKVEINKSNTGYKLIWESPKSPIISILVPTKDKLSLLKSCINSIYEYKCGIDFEIILIDNNSKDKKTLNFYKNIKNNLNYENIKLLQYLDVFNYSKVNNFASQYAKGEVLLFLNNDVEFISSNWGYELYSNAIRPQIGCVGSKLIYPNGTIQHAGVTLGINGTAGHSHKYFNKDQMGYQNRITLNQEISAVTGACMAIEKSKFLKIGMFDEKYLKINFSDLDLCLKAMKNQLKNLYLPEVLAIHHESATRSVTKGYQSLSSNYEKMIIKHRWKKLLNNDPFYSPYLTLSNESFAISLRKILHKDLTEI